MGWLPFLGNFAREGDAFKGFAYKTFTLISCSFIKSDRCDGSLYHISRDLSTFFDTEGFLANIGQGGKGIFKERNTAGFSNPRADLKIFARADHERAPVGLLAKCAPASRAYGAGQVRRATPANTKGSPIGEPIVLCRVSDLDAKPCVADLDAGRFCRG